MATTCPRVLQKAAGGEEDQHVYKAPTPCQALGWHLKHIFSCHHPSPPKKTNTPKRMLFAPGSR